MVIIIVLLLVYFFLPTLYFKFKYFINRSKKGNVIYLTFDDGPSVYTEKLLNLLKKYQVKASFFCVGQFALKYPEIIEEMKNDGHLIGLHSLSHKNYLLMRSNKTKQDFFESLIIMHNLGVKVNYFRPPWGHLSWWGWMFIIKYQLKPIFWHVMASDWKDISVSQIKENLLKKIRGGDIICLHDGRGTNEAPARTIEALEEVIPLLKKKGNVFERVDFFEK